MITGLESASDKTIINLIANLKSGILNVVAMGDKAYITKSVKECPPIAAFEVNMSLLEPFKAEALRRGLNYDEIGPDVSEYEQYWLDITT